MQLTEQTLLHLKNFAAINNQSMWFRADTIQRICDDDGSIFGQFEVPEAFPMAFGIYDLSKFLSTFRVLKNANLDFKKDHVVISDGKTSLKYTYCNPSIITIPPDDIPEIEDKLMEFILEAEDFTKITQLASLHSLTHLTFMNQSDDISMMASDPTDNDSNKVITKFEGDRQVWTNESKVSFEIDHLKIIPNRYKVEVDAIKVIFTSLINPNDRYIIGSYVGD